MRLTHESSLKQARSAAEQANYWKYDERKTIHLNLLEEVSSKIGWMHHQHCQPEISFKTCDQTSGESGLLPNEYDYNNL